MPDELVSRQDKKIQLVIPNTVVVRRSQSKKVYRCRELDLIEHTVPSQTISQITLCDIKNSNSTTDFFNVFRMQIEGNWLNAWNYMVSIWF